MSDRFTIAAAFGNVHGVYKPGNVKLTPKILRNSQEYVQKTLEQAQPHRLCISRGSGSTFKGNSWGHRLWRDQMNIEYRPSVCLYWRNSRLHGKQYRLPSHPNWNPEGGMSSTKILRSKKMASGRWGYFQKRLIKAFEDLNNVNTL